MTVEPPILPNDEETAAQAARILAGEVVAMREQIRQLSNIEKFKRNVVRFLGIMAAFILVVFAAVLVVGWEVDDGVKEIRRDQEVHRKRNEASHDCLADLLANLPPPAERTNEKAQDRIVRAFIGCVDQLAPTIIPPGVDANGKTEEGE